MKKIKCIIALCVLLLIHSYTFADSLRKSTPILTVTFLVKKYGELEIQLDNALIKKNTEVIQQLLANNFEERKSSNPISPIPRESWINSNLKKTAKNPLTIRQMAVRELGNIHVASYLAIKDSTSTFIVDIWKSENNKSQLLARYSSS